MAGINAAGSQFINDLVAERVISQLGQQGRIPTQAGISTAHVGGRAAHTGAERGNLGKGTAGFGRNHIDQRFADGK